MGEKDIAEKTLEAYNDVFADIINGALFNGEQVIVPDSLTEAQPFSQYKADTGKLHEQERDVAKYWNDNSLVRIAFLGIENQTAIDLDMPLRICSYDGAKYREQLNRDSSEASSDKVLRYPVITIVLYFGKTPWKHPRSLLDVVEVPEKLKPFFSDYRINVIDVPRMDPKQVERFKSDFKIVADYFVQMYRYNSAKMSPTSISGGDLMDKTGGGQSYPPPR